ncbi:MULTISPECIES: DUF2911 domain-containing protein [Emticicia]|uniref:DUF2911 domain-containing protein n=1 Tax=Emticicia TaxID=312278 RepID=UPI0007D8C0BF|nr:MULTISPECIES: DUF2911 domain-containing protein [Emticicia]
MNHSLTKLLLLILVSTLSFGQISTPAASPSASVSQTIGFAKVTIDYSRPSVKGRKIFGDLVPYAKVWRTGANKITSIQFDQDVHINGALMKAGSYGLYTIPNKNEWTIILNRDDKQWGAYGYDINKDVIRFNVQPTKPQTFAEQMSIDFIDFNATSAYVSIKWENTEVRFLIEQRGIDEKIMAEIAEKTAKPEVSNDTYFAAADFYYQKGIKLDQALAWANKVVEKEKEYWTYQLVARIAAKQNNCEVAVPNAEKSMELAKKAGDDAYIKLNQAVFTQCKKGY